MEQELFNQALDALREEGGLLSADQSEVIRQTLIEMAELLERYKHIVSRQQALMTIAMRTYRRYHALPKGVDPDPAKVLEWLLDSSGRKQATQMRETMEEIYTRLMDLGSLAFEQEYIVSGQFLIALRMRSRNALGRIQNESEAAGLVPEGTTTIRLSS